MVQENQVIMALITQLFSRGLSEGKYNMANDAKLTQFQNGTFKVTLYSFWGRRTKRNLVNIELSAADANEMVESVTMGPEDVEALIRLLRQAVAQAREFENNTPPSSV